jgi:hypothetical protein
LSGRCSDRTEGIHISRGLEQAQARARAGYRHIHSVTYFLSTTVAELSSVTKLSQNQKYYFYLRLLSPDVEGGSDNLEKKWGEGRGKRSGAIDQLWFWSERGHDRGWGQKAALIYVS